MKIVFRPVAENTLIDISEFIDDLNTFGSGERWLDKLLDFLESVAQPNVQYALCNHHTLAQLGFSCINFNNWVIAFKIEGDKFVVYRIVHGSVLA